jgi:hypothetical protein
MLAADRLTVINWLLVTDYSLLRLVTGFWLSECSVNPILLYRIWNTLSKGKFSSVIQVVVTGITFVNSRCSDNNCLPSDGRLIRCVGAPKSVRGRWIHVAAFISEVSSDLSMTRGGTAWVRFICFRIVTSGGLLWTRWWTFGFHEVLGNPLLAEQLFASEGLCFYMRNLYRD